ncbi:hypothetical protein GW916_03390 [bacterium]|nr:hypothetical protein [bacterium]
MKVRNQLMAAACALLFSNVLVAGGSPAPAPVDPCNGFDNPDLPVPPDTGTPILPCPEPPPRAEVPDLSPPEFSRTRRIPKTFVVDRPGTYDFGMELLEWSGEERCRSVKDPVPAVLVRSSNVTIKNLGITGAQNGIEIQGVNVRLENVNIWSCGTGVSIEEGAGRVFVSNSRFYGNPDTKDVLLDLGVGNVNVSQSLFVDGETCIAFGGRQDVNVAGSNFVGCQTSILGNTLNNQFFSTMLSGENQSWFGETFLHLIGHVRATSQSDLVYDGAKSKLEKDAHLIEK